MRKFRFWATVGGCLAASALLLMAQADRKPGLYEMTSSMTWQQSPMPMGMQAPAGSPFGGGPHTSQVCVTQQMIDRYGGPLPQSRGECQLKNMNKTATGTTGDYVCTGHMNGTGKFESNWTATGQSHTKIHFAGTMQMGQRSAPIEYTIDSSSSYKGADCGSVRPLTPTPD
jgi:Protein of unknown function (DUF3617)